MKSLEEYLTLAAQSHGHMCPGQVLGVRMAMLGLKQLGIDEPADFRKRLLTVVEIDRCATDAVSLVTGCRLGKRSLKFLDYGKVAATFVDLETGHAIRVVARDDSRLKAKEMFRGTNSGQMANPYKQQLEAYKIMSEEELFTVQEVRVKLKPARAGRRFSNDSRASAANNAGKALTTTASALWRGTYYAAAARVRGTTRQWRTNPASFGSERPFSLCHTDMPPVVFGSHPESG